MVCQIAWQVLTGIVDQLKPEDSLGVVLFSDGACTPRALASMKGADVAELKRRVSGRWCAGVVRKAGWSDEQRLMALTA